MPLSKKERANAIKAARKQICTALTRALVGLVIMANLIMVIIALEISTGTNTGHGNTSNSFKSLIESEASYAVVIPPAASRVSHNIYYLGDRQKNEQTVSGFIVMHRADASRVFSLRDEEDSTNYTQVHASGQQRCWDVYSNGAKWKNQESYVINTRNRQNLSPEFITTTFEAAVSMWNEQYPVFGSRIPLEGLRTNGASLDEPDGFNEVRFGGIAEPGVIALTVVWGIFDNAIPKREIVEWDMVFDDMDFPWGDADLDSDVMDYKNIATHELGHSCGFTDQYSSACSEATMFGYSSIGETKKRSLDMADRMAVCNLYGTCHGGYELQQEEEPSEVEADEHLQQIQNAATNFSLILRPYYLLSLLPFLIGIFFRNE